MGLTIFTFVILLLYVIIGSRRIEKLEMRQKELQWRIDSMENSIVRS